jgi:hypothetical protein
LLVDLSAGRRADVEDAVEHHRWPVPDPASIELFGISPIALQALIARELGRADLQGPLLPALEALVARGVTYEPGWGTALREVVTAAAH